MIGTVNRPGASRVRGLTWLVLAAGMLLTADAQAADPIPKLQPEETPPPKVRFIADPITDGAIISVSLGFGALSELVLTTGEIIPQQPQATSTLLGIDRIALTLNDKTAGTLSTVGAGVALAYAIIDPIASGYRDGIEAALVDGVMYAEALSITWAATNIAKLTVRRPRPSAYQEQERLDAIFGKDKAPNITETDTGLSFFSGHTAVVAAVSSTATYLAFARSPHTARPWITLSIGAALTTFVGIERVRAGAHFPTDVIAGAMAGFGIGLIVPHLHREATLKQQPVWVGFMPEKNGGGTVSLSGAF